MTLPFFIDQYPAHVKKAFKAWQDLNFDVYALPYTIPEKAPTLTEYIAQLNQRDLELKAKNDLYFIKILQQTLFPEDNPYFPYEKPTREELANNPYFESHMEWMTRFDLHNKADIASQLAIRDFATWQMHELYLTEKYKADYYRARVEELEAR